MKRFAFFLSFVTLAVPRSEAQEQVTETGSHALRALLNERDVRPIEWLGRLFNDSASETMIIVLGDASWVDSYFSGQRLHDFLAAGGAILIATDRADSARLRWPQYFGLQITGEQVRATRASDHYSEYPNCPFVIGPEVGRMVLDSEGDEGTLFDGRRVVTNNPSVVKVIDANWFAFPFEEGGSRLRRLAAYPQFCKTESGRPVLPFLSDYFAVGGTVLGSGRMLVLADHSIFINHMMLRSDTGNLEFAERCVDYLRGPGGARRSCLFVEDGRIVTNFRLRLAELPTAPPLPPPNVLINAAVQHGNAVLADLQDRNFFNRLVLGNMTARRLIRMLLGMLTFGLVVFGLVKLRRAGANTRPDPLMKTAYQPVTVGAGEGFSSRWKSQGEDGNWNAVARGVVREWVEHHGGSANAIPVVTGSLSRRKRLGSELTRLRDFAFVGFPKYQGRSATFTEKDWRAMRARMLELNKLAREGGWRFEQVTSHA